MHTGLVRVIRHDPHKNRVVTVSVDRTIRVWQLPHWRLVRAIRVPSEGVNEGKLGALAITPDGKTLAVGGWTGWDWDQTASVYLFDAESGEMVHRIHGLKDIVSYLAYSPDGRYLAVGLSGKEGLHIFDANNYQPVFQDREYGARVAYVEYSPKDNTLVTTADDGHIRVYDPERKLIVRQPIQISRQLGGMRVSPDGRMAVFGIQDIPMAVVVSMPDMRVLAKLTADDVLGQRGLCCIAWSRDGKHVYANGYFEGDGDTPIYRWDVPGFKQRKIITAAHQRIQSMFPLEDGSLLYATEDPSFGVIDASGLRARFIESPIGDFRQGYRTFRVSDDGNKIAFPMKKGGNETGYFSVRGLAYAKQPGPEPLLPAVGSAKTPSEAAATLQTDLGRMSLANRDNPGFRMNHWENSQKPELNGQRLAIFDSEFVRSYAVTPDQRFMLLGAEWSLRLYDHEGKIVWERQTPGVAWNVNVSGDGRYALASYGDGTIRWHRIQDGSELLALFPHNNGRDWVLWRPDGYYASSENGDNFVGWQVNRGKDRVPDFYRAIQFERVFYRPDLLRNALETAGGLVGLSAGDIFSMDALEQIAPPAIRISSLKTFNRQGTSYLDMEIKIDSGRLPAYEFGVYVNGIPVLGSEQRVLHDTERKVAVRKLSLPITEKANEIRVEAFNGTSLGLSETFVEFNDIGDPASSKGDMYVLAIGADRFSGFSAAAKMDLEFASRDAAEIVKFFNRNHRGLFNHVHTKLINETTDKPPTRQNILESLDFLKRAGPRDTVVLFLASHGFSDAAGNYFFLPRDGSEAEVNAIQSSKGLPDAKQSSLVNWQDIFNALRQAAGRRLLLVDTCHAKGVSGTFDAHSLKKRSAASLFALMVAAQANEYSQEYRPGQHGLFTYSLIEGMKGPADIDNNDLVSLEEVFGYTSHLVEALRSPRFRQTPDLIAPLSLRETTLSVRDKAAKPTVVIAKPKAITCGQEVMSRSLSPVGKCKD